MPKPENALIAEGVASTAYLVLTQGPLLTALCLFFGLDVFAIALVTAIPLVMQLFQLITPQLMRMVRSRKRLLSASLAARFVWLIVIGMLVLGPRHGTVFVAVFTVAQAANAIASNVWMALTRDGVPGKRRAEFLAHRNGWMSGATMVVVLAYSWILEHVPGNAGVELVLTATLAATVGALLAVKGLPELDGEAGATDRDVATEPADTPIATVLRDRNFRRLCIAFFVWNTIVLITAPYFSYHQLVNVQMPLTVVGTQAVAASLLSVAAYRMWASFARRFGTKKLMTTGMAIAAAVPLIWATMQPDFWITPLILDAFVAAIGWAAINTAVLALPMEVAPSNSTTYYAVYFAGGGLGGLLGALIGGTGARALVGMRFELLDYELYGIQLLFLASFLLRLAAIPLFAPVVRRRYITPRRLWYNALSVLARRSPLRGREVVRSRIRNGKDDAREVDSGKDDGSTR